MNTQLYRQFLLSFLAVSFFAGCKSSNPTGPDPIQNGGIIDFFPKKGVPSRQIIIKTYPYRSLDSAKLTSRIGDKAAQVYTSDNDTTIIYAPNVSGLKDKIYLTYGSDTSFTSKDDFEIWDNLHPDIFSFSPKYGPPGTSVRITGHRIGLEPVSRLNDTIVKSHFNYSDPQFPDWVTIDIPQNATSGLISCTTKEGVVTSVDSFIVTQLRYQDTAKAIISLENIPLMVQHDQETHPVKGKDDGSFTYPYSLSNSFTIQDTCLGVGYPHCNVDSLLQKPGYSLITESFHKEEGPNTTPTKTDSKTRALFILDTVNHLILDGKFTNYYGQFTSSWQQGGTYANGSDISISFHFTQVPYAENGTNIRIATITMDNFPVVDSIAYYRYEQHGGVNSGSTITDKAISFSPFTAQSKITIILPKW